MRSIVISRAGTKSSSPNEGQGKMAITLEIIPEDLCFLYTAKMEWQGIDWSAQEGRFQNVKGDDIDFTLANAYWLPDWTSAMIFRAYLTSINAPFQILLDNADGLDPYIVITNKEF
jgi:hypothetical protein